MRFPFEPHITPLNGSQTLTPPDLAVKVQGRYLGGPMTATLHCGDSLTVLRSLPDGVARCCVTSPPYWGLRDYGATGQYGLEPTPDAYVQRMVEVFREVRRVLADDGTLWLNLGDSYARTGGAVTKPGATAKAGNTLANVSTRGHERADAIGLKDKDLVGIPWRVAFALQADGWYLRSDIIWAKPNPMPESVTDRPTKAHEYVFLLSKRARYYYDAAAISEQVSPNTHARLSQDVMAQIGSSRANGGTREDRPMKAVGVNPKARQGKQGREKQNESFAAAVCMPVTERNSRSVWTVATQGYPGAHFATFPEELARRCILAGSAPGDTVLDPFGGSGTVAQVATGNGRSAIHIDLNPAYIELARQRIGPMLCDSHFQP